jgi:hypothetical protein
MPYYCFWMFKFKDEGYLSGRTERKRIAMGPVTQPASMLAGWRCRNRIRLPTMQWDVKTARDA